MAKKLLTIFAAPTMVALAVAATPAWAQGPINTLGQGQFTCELPGDATGRAGIEQPAESFVIASASRYRSPDGAGTYLRRGALLEMTSGPRNGDRYQIVSENFLRKYDGDKPGRLRCVRAG